MMKHVTCGRCRTKFLVDLRRIRESTEKSNPYQVGQENVVALICPHCKAQRQFLLCGLENEPSIQS